MTIFSERNSYSNKNQLNREDMTQDLRVGLWNVVYENIVYFESDGKFTHFQNKILIYFHKPVDEFRANKTVQLIKTFFLSEETKWFKVYDFIEFIISYIVNNSFKLPGLDIFFINNCNSVLEKEKSAWRIDKLNGMIIPLMSQKEEDSINTAIQNTVYGKNIKKALEHLSRRENPDYENSIKESISAVESLIKALVTTKKGTLGQLIEKELPKLEPAIHPALLKGFSSLYGFTSDANGVRHVTKGGRLEGDLETAQYMLVSCSAFCNFLESKYKEKLK